jgi:hypothetical protein
MTTAGTPGGVEPLHDAQADPCRPQTIMCPRHAAYVLTILCIVTCTDVRNVSGTSW